MTVSICKYITNVSEDFSAGSPATMFRLYKGSNLIRNVGTYQTTRRYTKEGLYLSLRSSLPAAAAAAAAAAVGYDTKREVNIAERWRVGANWCRSAERKKGRTIR
jgi:hypothetical protein